MWFIVKTDIGTEKESIAFLKEKFSDTIIAFYFPLGRKVYKTERGEEKVRFVPVLPGLFFIKVENRKRLERILSHCGCFVYKGLDYAARSSETVERTFFTKAHLLCAANRALALDEIIRQANIPDGDMERFMFYNEQLANGIEGLSVVDKSYNELVKKNDTIRILSGPLAGWVGVVKQVKQNGRKDRHLLVRFGNSHCLNISNIRQYDMQIEHEATEGAKSEAVGAWRAIDQIIGFLQVKNPEENAAATLRGMFLEYHKKQICRDRKASDKTYYNKVWEQESVRKATVLENIAEPMRSNFRILTRYFHADNATSVQGLKSLIPDVVLRPFLTPTSAVAIPEGHDYAVLQHNGICELTLRCNLREFFRGKESEYEADKYAPVFDEDYEYFAHIALLENDNGKVKAVTSWGGFYDYYASQSKAERAKFIEELKTKKYFRFHSLLTGDNCDGRVADIANVVFEKVNGIGGFSFVLDVEYDNRDIPQMAKKVAAILARPKSQFRSVVAAAVEIWQGTRMLVWRQLLQRHVLLHKVPVADRPSVIPPDADFEVKFAKVGGDLNIKAINAALEVREEKINAYLQRGEYSQAVFSLLSTTFVLSSHFVQDELYNYISEAFNPDRILTNLFKVVMKKLKKASYNHRHPISVILHDGMMELQSMDSWIYFKFPNWLKEVEK